MIGKTLYKYYTSQILKSFAKIGICISVLFTLIEFVGLVTRVDTSLYNIFEMTLYKTPNIIFNSMPMIILLVFIYTFYKQNKNQEITASLSSGISMPQILIPSIIFAFVFGIITTTILQPIAVQTNKNFDYMWDLDKKNEQTTLKLSKTGLWLKEKLPNKYHRIINAKKINKNTFELSKVQIIEFNEEKNNIKVINSDKMIILGDELILKNAIDYTEKPSIKYETLIIKTSINKDIIRRVFTKIDKISFWQLNEYIKRLKQSELNANEGIFILNFLISIPIIFVATVFIASFFSARPLSRVHTKKTIISGVLTGFALYFYINSFKSLVLVSEISPIIIGWTPALSMLLLGIFLLLSSDKVNN
ncbi:MAG: LptF/LptG family permease [Alphaproteobacteria bacterium]